LIVLLWMPRSIVLRVSGVIPHFPHHTTLLSPHRAAAMTLRTVLLSIQALLQAAEPDDPQDAVVARQYKEDPEMYKKTAKHWAQVYAGGE